MFFCLRYLHFIPIKSTARPPRLKNRYLQLTYKPPPNTLKHMYFMDDP